MRITSTTGFKSGGTGSREASIRAQIRKLEKKKAELLKKLGGGGGGSDSGAAPAQAAKGHVSVNSQSIASTGPAVPAAQAGGEQQGAPDYGQMLRDFQASLPPADDGGEESLPAEDPKEILKRIQLLEMQIMMLRQQLEDDTLTGAALSDEELKEQAEGVKEMAMQNLANSVALREAVVTDGHVDGYA